jgi:salicylate hydroxylase
VTFRSTQATVLVAGAGIAGLATALCLARAGHAVRLVERRDEPNEAGAGLQISPNASHLLVALGLGEAIGAVATRPRRLLVRRAEDGRDIGAMPMNDRADPAAPFWSVMRQDLHGALLSAVRGEPLVRLETAAGLEIGQTGEAMVKRGDDAADPARHPLIVGADGLWTVSRRLTGETVRPVFSGLEACRTLVETGAAPAHLTGDDIHLWLGSGFHCVHYPVDNGRRTNLVLIRRASRAVEGWSEARPASDIQASLPPMAAPLRRLVEAAPGWLVWSLFDRPPAAAPAHPALALVGDAAHPMLPFLAQGASMAIEDAAVLASLLPGPGGLEPEAVRAALVLYRRARENRTARVVKTARTNARLYHLSFPASRARDLMMATLGPAGMRARHAWLYDWRLALRTAGVPVS